MTYLLTIALLGFLSFFIVKKSFLRQKALNNNLNALPNYYGYCSSIWFVISILAISIFLLFIEKFSSSSFLFFALSLTVLVNLFFKYKITPHFHARLHFEKLLIYALKAISTISIFITFAIVVSILIEALRFFSEISLFDFLFGTKWSPQIAMHADQAGSSGSFGAIPVFLGTFLITFIAIIIAVPFGIFSAIYLSEYSNNRFRNISKPMLEILAGIPTVVYGYFAAFTVAPLLKSFFENFGITVELESALAAGVVMGIMIIPFVLSLSDDAMNAVPVALKNASLGMGATKSETILKVVIPAALPGIIGAILLAISRAIGETMIVTMAAGLNANLTFNPLNAVTTATAQIVTLLVGDQEFDSVKTLAAFALGITLFVITLILNLIALVIVKKYREQYD